MSAWELPLDAETERRFWEKVNKTGTCWLWTDKRSVRGGYGRFGAKRIGDDTRRLHYAHRISYELTTGPIPDGFRIDHTCHVTNCVNPGHLRPVTIKQNMENMGGPSRASKSGIRGVYRNHRNGLWTGQVTHKGTRYSLRSYAALEDAEAAIIALRNRLYTHNDLDRRQAA